jgi:hypothetical protein
MVVTIDNGENFKIESYDPISKHHCKLTSTERPQPVAAESVGKSAGAVGTNLDVRAAQQWYAIICLKLRSPQPGHPST